MTMESTLAIKLKSDFDFTPSEIGFYFLLFSLGSTLSMGSMILVPEKWDKRKFIFPSLILTALFSMMLGPS